MKRSRIHTLIFVEGEENASKISSELALYDVHGVRVQYFNFAAIISHPDTLDYMALLAKDYNVVYVLTPNLRWTQKIAAAIPNAIPVPSKCCADISILLNWLTMDS